MQLECQKYKDSVTWKRRLMVQPCFFVGNLMTAGTPAYSLELMGCLALSRLYRTCREALEFAEISSCKKVFWIDSQVVLSWLKTSPRKFKPFVSVRVAEIQETIDPQEFSYIRSEHNPADALTKGILPEQLEKWSQGPQFLESRKRSGPNLKKMRWRSMKSCQLKWNLPLKPDQRPATKQNFQLPRKN